MGIWAPITDMSFFLFLQHSQPFKDICQLGLCCGFMSTYNGTVFLRQVLMDGEWCLQYSPVIRSETVNMRTAPPSSWKNSFSCMNVCSIWEGPQVFEAALITTQALGLFRPGELAPGGPMMAIERIEWRG